MFSIFKTKPDLSAYNVEHIKIDKVKLTVFNDPLKMPYKRVLQYFLSVDSIRLGIVREDLDAFKATMRHEINQGNWSKVIGVFEHFIAFTDLYAVEKNMMQLGATFIMLPGEDPKEPVEADYIKKYELCESSEEMRAFFLSRSYSSLRKSKGSKIDFDILEYLNLPQTKKAAQTFLNLIHSSKHKIA
jgi:hypothetical protein